MMSRASGKRFAGACRHRRVVPLNRVGVKTVDLKQLAYFVRIAELGSISKAAGALAIAQPALSRQLRALEVELKANLFLRNGRACC